MKCPECGSKTITIDSRDRDGTRMRRRECSQGHRFTTWEVAAPNLDEAVTRAIYDRVALALVEGVPQVVELIASKFKL